MIFNMGGGGSENLTEQMNQLDILLTEVEESLVGKASGANITPETILKGYRGYKNKELVVGAYDASNLVPENVREGVSFGAGLVGAMSEGMALPYGITSYNVSYQTFSSRKTLYGSFNHGDNKTPQMIIIFPNGDVSNATSSSYPHLIYAMVLSNGGTTGELIYRQKSTTGDITTSRTVCSLTSATVSVSGYIYTAFQAGVEYGFITMA